MRFPDHKDLTLKDIREMEDLQIQRFIAKSSEHRTLSETLQPYRPNKWIGSLTVLVSISFGLVVGYWVLR